MHLLLEKGNGSVQAVTYLIQPSALLATPYLQLKLKVSSFYFMKSQRVIFL